MSATVAAKFVLTDYHDIPKLDEPALLTRSYPLGPTTDSYSPENSPSRFRRSQPSVCLVLLFFHNAVVAHNHPHVVASARRS